VVLGPAQPLLRMPLCLLCSGSLLFYNFSKSQSRCVNCMSLDLADRFFC